MTRAEEEFEAMFPRQASADPRADDAGMRYLSTSYQQLRMVYLEGFKRRGELDAELATEHGENYVAKDIRKLDE